MAETMPERWTGTQGACKLVEMKMINAPIRAARQIGHAG
jgi:hypothetical protein